MNTLGDRARSFCMSDLYPPTVCALILIGNVTGLEVYLNILVSLLAAGSLIFCDSVRPFITPMCAYIYQVSRYHTPFYPAYSNYYYTGWRLPINLFSFSLILSGVIVFILKRRKDTRLSLRDTPLLKPLIFLSLAFLSGGAFFEGWTPQNFAVALANISVYLFTFLFIYFGFSHEEGATALADHLVYDSLFISLLISLELLFLFFTSDVVIKNGAVVKDAVALGWGIWNLVALSLAVLIPILFYGVERSKHPALYFVAATLSYISSLLTLSRNALIFSSLAYFGCLFALSFVGRHKRPFRIVGGCCALAVLFLFVFFFDGIRLFFLDYFERGFSDNGRFAIWRAALEGFSKNRLFGTGFYGLKVDTAVFGPLPKQAHNTVLQLLSATGLFGLFSYLYYRVVTLRAFLRRPSFMKSMLGASVLVLLLMSLFDNFVFNVYPMLYYDVILAIVCRADKEREKSLQKISKNY